MTINAADHGVAVLLYEVYSDQNINERHSNI